MDVRWRELFLSVVPFCVSMFAVRVCCVTVSLVAMENEIGEMQSGERQVERSSRDLETRLATLSRLTCELSATTDELLYRCVDH